MSVKFLWTLSSQDRFSHSLSLVTIILKVDDLVMSRDLHAGSISVPGTGLEVFLSDIIKMLVLCTKQNRFP